MLFDNHPWILIEYIILTPLLSAKLKGEIDMARENLKHYKVSITQQLIGVDTLYHCHPQFIWKCYRIKHVFGHHLLVYSCLTPRAPFRRRVNKNTQRNSKIYRYVTMYSLSPDFSDLLDLADFRYYVPHWSLFSLLYQYD